MKILIYSFNDKIGDGLQKISFLQEIKRIYPNSHVTYTTTNTTTLKDKLNPLVQDCIDELELSFCGFENNQIISIFKNTYGTNSDLYDLNLWHQFEEKNPNIFAGMYQFWCQKL